jgi:predicted PurR-regulated permease PerM
MAAMAELTDRQRRLFDTALVLGVIVLAFLVIDFVARVFFGFFDVLLLFFLAWLLAFALGPLIRGVQRLAPRLPQAAAVALVYAAVALVIVVSLIQLSASLATSIGQLLNDLPRLQLELERLTRAIQERLQGLGFNVDLVSQVPQIVDNLQDYADDLIGPLQSLAVASMGVFGNMLILFML